MVDDIHTNAVSSSWTITDYHLPEDDEVAKSVVEEWSPRRLNWPVVLRHFRTTTMKQHYGLNDEELKMLLGHKRAGNGLNRVYNHAADETLRENTLRKLGEQDGHIAKPLTPDQCDNCDETLRSHWTHCPVCGVAYGP